MSVITLCAAACAWTCRIPAQTADPAAAVAHNATSCAISNFPDEHRPAADYLRQIRHELALAWRGFALSVNGALLAGTPDASTLH